jgi:hypothetical protein
LVVHESHIDLVGVEIGGIRAGSIIRRVITTLAPKPGQAARRMSAKALSETLENISGPSVTSAINDFRTQCSDKMRAAGWDCGKGDIIETAPGGGYRIKAGIVVREGLQPPAKPQVEEDSEAILRLFSRHTSLTHKQISEGVAFSALRVKAALGRLTDGKRLKHVSGSGATTTYEVQARP